jgi:nucleotide-binding universal stress UspA family protein
MYQRILCPVDGSEAGTAGLDEAIRFAQKQRATIRLLHVIDRVHLVERRHQIEDASERQLREGFRILEMARAKVAAAEVAVQTTLCDRCIGRVADEIVGNCRLWDADLIVMGTRGCRSADNIFIGSDAEAVIQLSEVPVLLVQSSQNSHQRLIIAATKRYDFSDALICYASSHLPHQHTARHIICSK